MFENFLVIGATGQLGTALRRAMPDIKATARKQLDITDSESLARFDWNGIEVVINAAAYTNVDGAESSGGRRKALQANVIGPVNLATVAIEHDLTLVHISSEYVFDGSRELHHETEPLSPLSVYGMTKAAADLVVSAAPKHYILRTSWLIGDGHNFVRTMMRLARDGMQPKVVNDQIGRLTFAGTLVDAIQHLYKSRADFGIYNATNNGPPASWAEIAQIVFSKLGRDELSVSEISTEEYFHDHPDAAARPMHSTLDLAKIQATGWEPTDWRTELDAYISRGAV